MQANSHSLPDVAVLIVDDDQISVMAAKRAIKRLELPFRLTVARDGVEALQILRGEDGHAVPDKPFVILLDINMPRMDGHEFLDELRCDEHLQRAVVFVLTTSDTKRDIDQAYSRNVAGYFVKGESFEEMLSRINALGVYMGNSMLPTPLTQR